MLKVIELFAGVGSQTQALKNIGVEHEIVAISDNDKPADKTYRVLHNPNVNNLGDIRKIEALPKADLWTYSFPCQDISVAGLQRGFEQGSGTRSGLLWEVERLLLKAKEQEILPKYLLLENVKNLIGKKFKGNYEKWLSFLSGLGYTTYTKVLNAKDFGVPQNRERVFGVSILGQHESFEFPKPRELKIRLKDVLEENVDERYYLKASTIISILNTTFHQRADLIHGENEVCATLCARDFHEPKLIAVGKLEGGVWDKRYNQIRQVFHPDGISPTIMAGGGGGTETKIIAIRGREEGQVIEPNKKGTTNALTTVQKDNLVVEQNAIARNYRSFIKRKGYIPELFNPWNTKELKEISPTQTTNCGSNFATSTVLKAETHCLNYYDENGKQRSVQDRIYDSLGVSVAVTPSFRGNIAVKSATKKGYEEAREGYSINIEYPNSKTRRGRVGKGVAQILKTQCNQATMETGKIHTVGNYSPSGHNASRIVDNEGIAPTVMENHGTVTAVTDYLRIRKLTPTECWRLMGWNDEQISKVKASGISNTQMYKQAGNGIVVSVLEEIFKNLFRSNT